MIWLHRTMDPLSSQSNGRARPVRTAGRLFLTCADDDRTGKKKQHSLTLNRRKKTRCPGQKPRCSLCVHLTQRCIYAEEKRRPNRLARGRGRQTRASFTLEQGQYEVRTLSVSHITVDSFMIAVKPIKRGRDQAVRLGTGFKVSIPTPKSFKGPLPSHLMAALTFSDQSQRNCRLE